LTFVDIDDLRNAERDSYQHQRWAQFSGFHKDGDRLLSYRRPASSGLLLVRGDRLVWEYDEIRYCVVDTSLRWNANYEHFLALGGNRAFLAGEFSWPPPDWINPVTDEVC